MNIKNECLNLFNEGLYVLNEIACRKAEENTTVDIQSYMKHTDLKRQFTKLSSFISLPLLAL